MRARLLGTVYEVTIIPRQASAAAYDDLAGEYYAGGPSGETVAVCMQIDVDADQTRRPEAAGDHNPKRYRFTALVREAKAAGWNPRSGDRIVSMRSKRSGELALCDLYVENVRTDGHTRYGAELVVGRLEDVKSRKGAPEEGLFS